MAACDEYTDYFSELNDIEQENESTESVDEDTLRTPDEGEDAMTWLNDTGYGHLASKIEEGEVVDRELLDREMWSLDKDEAAAVKKRVDTLNATLNKREQQRADVREIFASSTQSHAIANGGKAPALVGPQSAVTNGASYRTKLLGHRGFYSLTSASSTSVDGFSKSGVSIIGVHPTSEINSTVDGRTKGDEPRSNVSVHPACRHCHFTVVNSSHSDCFNESLPDIVTTEDDLGVTLVDGLSKKDLDRVRSLALIDLTALFDMHGITFVRRKAKSRGRESGLFGVSLDVLLEHDQKKSPQLRVPLILNELIKHIEATGLKEEGILRIPGSLTRVKSLRQELESRYKRGKLSLEDLQPHDAATLLKQFLRELPTPLLTFEYLEAFAQVNRIGDLAQQIEALNFLVLLLPDVNRNSLQMLLQMLQAITKASYSNKMTLNSVAMIIAPNLFLVGTSPPSGRAGSTGARRAPKRMKTLLEVSTAADISSVIRLVLYYQDLLWQVPAFIMSRVRHQYQVECVCGGENRPPFLKRLGRKNKSDLRKNSTSVEEDFPLSSHVIRVTAPQLSKFNMAIQLDQRLTAGDVVERFTSPDGTSGNRNGEGHALQPVVHLYEVGGNIGERRLDRETNIMSVCRVNPHAEWVIKM